MKKAGVTKAQSPSRAKIEIAIREAILASQVDTDMGQLETEENLQSLIKKAKQLIAEKVGVSVSSVKISIDY